jgi:signal transduction histidine kinase
MRTSSIEPRILNIIEVVRRFAEGHFDLDFAAAPDDEIGPLEQALKELGISLVSRRNELQKLDSITQVINTGLLLDDILENIYESFHNVIPYNRIGFSLIDKDDQTVRSHWARTDQPRVHLKKGYSAPLAGSSLQTIIETGKPRILNDLVQYLKHKPASKSTRLMVKEGIRSSLTCPLITNAVPVGFIFFSSIEPGTYNNNHIGTFQKIATQLSAIVEKGRLVSELSERKEAIAEQNKELRKLDDVKNKFLGIAAHDLRNPLANIQLAASLMQDTLVELSRDESDFLLNDINRQAHYMFTLIEDLLDVSQIESGYLELRLEQLPLQPFLIEAVHRHTHPALLKKIKVLYQPSPGGTICADPIRLRQVIDNLVSNAVKYSPQGSTVTVWAEENQGTWKINVQDEGPGIKPEEQGKLFQFFGRLTSRPTGGEKSTGLGLAISRRIVEAHGGRIGVDSEVGHSSTFWFTLPVDLAPCEKT